MSSSWGNAVRYGRQAYNAYQQYKPQVQNVMSQIRSFSRGRLKPVRALARAVTKQQRTLSKVRHVIDCQRRYNAITQTNIAFVTTGTFQLLNGMATGDTDGTREGQCIYLKSIKIRMAIQSDTSTTDNTNEIRIMLIYDKQPNGAILPLNQVLYDSTAGAIALLSSRHPDFMKRFAVLYDKNYSLHTLPNTGATPGADVAGLPIKFLTISRAFPKGATETQYNGGNAGTVADITRGSLYLVVLGRSTNGQFWAQTLLNYSE